MVNTGRCWEGGAALNSRVCHLECIKWTQFKEVLKVENFWLLVTSKETRRNLSKHCSSVGLVQEAFI